MPDQPRSGELFFSGANTSLRFYKIVYVWIEKTKEVKFIEISTSIRVCSLAFLTTSIKCSGIPLRHSRTTHPGPLPMRTTGGLTWATSSSASESEAFFSLSSLHFVSFYPPSESVFVFAKVNDSFLHFLQHLKRIQN